MEIKVTIEDGDFGFKFTKSQKKELAEYLASFIDDDLYDPILDAATDWCYDNDVEYEDDDDDDEDDE